MCHTEGEAGAPSAGPVTRPVDPGALWQRQQPAVNKVGASRAGKIASSLSSAICDTTTEGLATPLGDPTRC